MSPKISDVTLTKINFLLKEDKDWDEKLTQKRYDYLSEVQKLPDGEKGLINNYILHWLDTGRHNPWQRAWALSTLAQLGCREGNERVRKHMLCQSEDNYWTRHFALLNGATFEPFPEKEIQEAADKDPHALPKATALRLLISNGDRNYEDALINMLQNKGDRNQRWAAARVLRTRSELKMKALSPETENTFIPILVTVAGYKYEPMDSRWECVQALASFSEKKVVTTALAELLMKNEEQDAMIRRYFLGALIELKEGREAQKALIKSLEDSDAEIRVQAANAMKNMIGVEESVKLLVPLVFEPERKDASYLLDAMRLIDKGKAANLLREEMNSPNARTSRRASELLIDLGGEAAAQILLNERTKALDRYTRILTSADYEVRQHFNQLMSQATSAFWISMAMHTVIFLFGVAALTGSLMLAFNGGEKSVATWAAGGVGVAGVLLTTFYKNPLQNMRASLNALMQVNVVFLGYVRQINQIDATFKHLFLEPQGFGTTQMKEIVVEIQNTVIRALEEIKKYIMEKPDIQKQEMKKQKAEESQSAA